VQALIDDLIERGLVRRSFGRHTPIALPDSQGPEYHGASIAGSACSVRRALRQAWELDDAAKAEKLIRNLAQRLARDAPGVSKSILEGLDEILMVSSSVCRPSCGARLPVQT
jgi:putative transposase